MSKYYKNRSQSSKTGEKKNWDEIVTERKEREGKAFDLFADMLIKKLENAQKTQWKKPWFAEGEMAWPKALYGKPYHGMNALMLTLLCEEKGYKVPVFATRERVFSLNFQKDADGKTVQDEKGHGQRAVDANGQKLPFVHVLKDEHSFPVFLTKVTVMNPETKEKIRWADYVNLEPEEQEKYNVYTKRFMHYVFNIDQTNLKEARPELYEKIVKENTPQQVDVAEGEEFSFAPIDVMIDKQLWICPVKVQELKGGQSPHFSITKNEVVIGLKSQYVKGGHPESWVNDCFHEMIHSTGHESCLDRFKGERDRNSYAREELVAEVGAALSCHRYGIPKTIKEDSVPYVKSWLSELHENPDFIRTVLKDVKMATSVLDSKIEHVRKVYLGEEDKLDIREEEVSTLEYDETGDAHLGEGESLGADKKQGHGEGVNQEPSETEEHKRGGMRR